MTTSINQHINNPQVNANANKPQANISTDQSLEDNNIYIDSTNHNIQYMNALFDGCIANLQTVNELIDKHREENLFDVMSDNGHEELQSAVGKFKDTNEQCKTFIDKCDEETRIIEANPSAQTANYKIMLKFTSNMVRQMYGISSQQLMTITGLLAAGSKSDHLTTMAQLTSSEGVALNKQVSMIQELLNLGSLLVANMVNSDADGKKKDAENDNKTVTPPKTLGEYQQNGNIFISNADAFKSTKLYDLFVNVHTDGTKQTAEISQDDFKKFFNDRGREYAATLTPEQQENQSLKDNFGDTLLGLTTSGLQAQVKNLEDTLTSLQQQASRSPNALEQISKGIERLLGEFMAILRASSNN